MPLVHLQNLWRDLSPVGKKTLQWDLVRGSLDGAGQSFIQTIGLLIAIKYFDCSNNLKALIVAGSFAGMTFSFLYATYSHYWIGRRNVEAALPVLVSAFFLMVSSQASHPTWYAVFAFFAGLFFTIKFPLMTSLYRENYRRQVRGQVFSFSLVVGGISAALLTYGAGHYLEMGEENFRTILLFFGLATCGSGFAILNLPSTPGVVAQRPKPFSSFGVLTKDKMFLYVLITWFLFGSANLGLLPQRIELLSQPEYGFLLSPAAIALIVGVVPETVRMLLVIPMGWLFDRMNFIILRIVINLFFFAYTIVFFHAHSVATLVLGSVLLGVGFAGGSISWNLWVTKYAPPEETSKYMAMHTLFNGVRGILGPYAWYWVAADDQIPQAALMSTSLIVVSCLLLLPLVKMGAPYDRGKMEAAISEG